MFGKLLLHSFGSTPKEFYELIVYPEDLEFCTSTPLLSRHGSITEDRAILNYKKWLFIPDKAFKELDKYCQGTYAINRMFGTVLVLNVASNQPGILGLIILSDFVRINKQQKLIKSIFTSYDSFQ